MTKNLIKIDKIDRVDNKKNCERYQIQKKQANEMNLESSETDERDQIENPTKSNMSKIQEPRGDGGLVDTDTELEHGSVHDIKEVGNKMKKILPL